MSKSRRLSIASIVVGVSWRRRAASESRLPYALYFEFVQLKGVVIVRMCDELADMERALADIAENSDIGSGNG